MAVFSKRKIVDVSYFENELHSILSEFDPVEINVPSTALLAVFGSNENCNVVISDNIVKINTFAQFIQLREAFTRSVESDVQEDDSDDVLPKVIAVDAVPFPNDLPCSFNRKDSVSGMSLLTATTL